MIAWESVQTVFLDLDGTLLDLHFDNHFWLDHVPVRFAEKHGLSPDAARAEVHARYKAHEGTLNWYCVDHWTRELDLDIPALKEEVGELIRLRPEVPEFLDAVRASARPLVLVTNAHRKTLAIKFRRTGLDQHLDRIISSHDLGLPKEDPRFWGRVQGILPFDPATTLFLDDSLSVLRTARAFGIGHIIAIRQPDSRGPVRDLTEFPAIHRFQELMPVRSCRPTSSHAWSTR